MVFHFFALLLKTFKIIQIYNISTKNRISAMLEDGCVTTKKCRLFHVYRNVAFFKSTYKDKKQDINKFLLKLVHFFLKIFILLEHF